MKHMLNKHSPIFEYIGCISLMNLQTGNEDRTLDKDAKHIFKRIQNTSIWTKGIDIYGLTVIPSLLEHHLLDSGMSVVHVHSLLQLNDRQDVPLAFGLLVAIANLPDPNPNKPATYIHTQATLKFLGNVWMALLSPYTNISISLQEQLTSLSIRGYHS